MESWWRKVAKREHQLLIMFEGGCQSFWRLRKGRKEVVRRWMEETGGEEKRYLFIW